MAAVPGELCGDDDWDGLWGEAKPGLRQFRDRISGSIAYGYGVGGAVPRISTCFLTNVYTVVKYQVPVRYKYGPNICISASLCRVRRESAVGWISLEHTLFVLGHTVPPA